MSCIDITLSVLSAEADIYCSSVTDEVSIYASAVTTDEVEVSAVEVSVAADLTAFNAATPPEFSISSVCTLAEFISCIGNGMWLNQLPWVNKEGWKN